MRSKGPSKPSAAICAASTPLIAALPAWNGFAGVPNELLDADREMSYIYHKDGKASSNSNAEMAEKIDAARTETDVEKRKALYAEVQQMGRDLNYTVPLFNLNDIYGMSERLTWQPRVDAKLMIREMQVAE